MSFSILALFFSSFQSFDYEKAWKRVEEHLQKGLPKSALEEVDLIYEHALKDNNTSQQIKAFTYQINLILNTEELGLEKVITKMDESIGRSPSPSNEILQSLSAELFANYFNQQYYTISQRTNVVDNDLSDIRTWTTGDFREFITERYLSSLSPDLKKYSSSDFKDVIANAKNADFSLRPTLYELLLDRALRHFASGDRRGVKPSFHFKMDDSSYLAPVEEFVRLEIGTKDTSSHLYKSLLLFQDILRLELNKEDRTILSLYDHARMNFVYRNGEMKDREALYFESLNAAVNKYAKQLAHPFQLDLAAIYSNKQDYEKSIDVYKNILDSDPTEFVKNSAERGIANIKAQSLNVQTEQVIPLNKDFLVHVSSRNIDKVYLKVFDASDHSFDDIFKGKSEDQYKRIEKLKEVTKSNKKNIRKGYISSSFEIIMNGLPGGKYIIAASNSKDFCSDKTAYVYSTVIVSDLAYSSYNTSQGKLVSVRDRNSGQPIEGATVDAFVREYNRSERKYELNFLSSQKSDKEGFARFEIEGNKSFSFKVKYGDDLLDMEQVDYNNEIYKRGYLSKQVEIFTDRAIYRPGQIVHFKTLSMKIDDEGVPSIDPQKELSVSLRDANGQEVEKINLTGNEFGSASGSFTLPVGRLTGQFSIQVQEGGRSNTHYFRVEEYKRPKFEVRIDDMEGEVKLGDTITVTGIAKAMFGAPVSNARLSYNVTRSSYFGWWAWYRRIPNSSTNIKNEEINTDGEGRFSLSFVALPDEDMDPSKNPSYSYSVEVDVTDIAGETRSAEKMVAVGVFPYAYAWKMDEVMDISDLKSINISATTLEDEKIEAKGVMIISELIQPEKWTKPRLWSTPSDPIYRRDEFEKRIDRIAPSSSRMSDYPVKEEIMRIELEYGDKGLDYDFAKVLKAGAAYKIDLVSDEEYRGHKVKDTKYLAVRDMDNNIYPNVHLFYTDGTKNIAEVGQPFHVALGTSDSNLSAFYQIVRDWEILEQGMIELHNSSKITYTPRERDRGGFTIIIDYVKHNYYQRVRHNIELPWDNKELKVELLTVRDKVLPGSKEEWQLKISGKKKDALMAEMLATMYDASLDQFINHSYTFNPYMNHFGNIRARFYGFDYGRNGNLNYRWSRNDIGHYPRPVIPMLQGLNLYNYGEFAPVRVGDISVRGSRSNATEQYVDGVRMEKMAQSAPAEAEMVAGAMEAEVEESAMADLDAADAKDGSVENKKAEISIRKNLDESVFFYPHLRTDAEGNLLLSFTMNEALTRWKLLTFAHDKELRFGMSTHEVKTQKDVMIVPNAPRFIREGDRLVFPATVTNLSDKDITVDARLEIVDPVTEMSLDTLFGLQSNDRTFAVAKGISARVDWSIAVPKDYKGMIKYRVIAQSGDHSDGEENILPVLTNQTLVTETKVISLKKHETKAFEFDALNRTKTATSQPYKYALEYTSNPVWYAVQALPYLMEYPHKCSEQIFNRLYANTMASHIANQNPRLKAVFDQWKALDSNALLSNLEKNESLKSAILEETPWVRQANSETEQKKRIALLFDLNKMSNETKAVLDELSKRQLPNGAFPWFAGGREDVYITQNIVEGIAHLKHLGILLESDYQFDKILERALVYLDEQSKKRYDRIVANIKRYGGNLDDDHLSQISIHYLYTRSFFAERAVHQGAEEAYTYFMSQAEKHWLKKGFYAEAMIGLVLKRSGNQSFNDIKSSLVERSFYSEELGRYWNMGNGFQWHELPIESHAMLIEFFTETEEDKSFVEDMKIWLLKNKQTNHWKTTKGTAAAIYALLIQGEEGMISWIEEDNTPIIRTGNTQLDLTATDTESGTGYFQKTWLSDDISEELSSITIENKNETIAWGAAYYQYFEDLDKIKGFDDTPLKLSRRLFKEVRTDGSPTLIEIQEGTDLIPGDRVIARIEIRSDRDMTYVHLKDMRGSGFEPENVLSGYRWKGGLGYYESTRDLASHFFISHLNKGTYVFEYPMRVVHKGEYSTGIATIQCMYAPEFTSHSDGGRVEVK